MPGACLPSYGTLCAQMCGVRPEVVARAHTILQLSSQGKPVPVVPQLQEVPKRKYLAQVLQQLAGLQVDECMGHDKGSGSGGGSEGVTAARAAAAAQLLLSVARAMGEV